MVTRHICHTCMHRGDPGSDICLYCHDVYMEKGYHPKWKKRTDTQSIGTALLYLAAVSIGIVMAWRVIIAQDWIGWFVRWWMVR